MSNAVSFGYNRPSQDSIEIIDFKVVIDGEAFDSKTEELPTWDYESKVEVFAELDFDFERFTKEAGFISFAADEDLPEYSGLISWSCNKTRQRGASPRQSLHDGKNTLHFELDSLLLGGELQIAINVDLETPGVAYEDLIPPERPGSRLWASYPLRIRLEGDGSQMSITPLDFKETGIRPQMAMWKVQVSPDVLLPVQAGLRILINTAHPTSRRMLEKGSGKEKQMWERYLQTDIVTQLLLRAPSLDEIENLESHSLFSGSLAESIFNLAQALFPEKPYADIANDPATLFATVQAFTFKESK